MRAAMITEPGTIQVTETETPSIGTGDARVRVEAAALNHRDNWRLAGSRDQPFPYIPGSDVAGVVDEVGPGVDGVEPGDRVVICPMSTCGTCRFCREGPEHHCSSFSVFDGAFAEYCTVEADRLVALPNSVGYVEAAALPVAYITAWRMLTVADVGPTDRVFVPGATGGVGLAASQLAHIRGASVIGTTRWERKVDRLEALGVTWPICADDPETIRRAVEEIGTVDATINHLGGPFTTLGVEVLRRGGVMAVCGRTAGNSSEIDNRTLYWQHKSIVGSTLGTQTDLETLVTLVADGRLEPVIGHRFDLGDIDRAFEVMDQGDVFGKIVVVP